MCACNCTTEKPDNGGTDTPDPKPEVVKKDVVAYVTTEDSRKQFEMSTFKFGKPGSMSPSQVMYDKTALSETTVDGFGLAVTTAAAYNLMQMTQSDRTAFLEVGSSILIGFKGSGFSMSHTESPISKFTFLSKSNSTAHISPACNAFLAFSFPKPSNV